MCVYLCPCVDKCMCVSKHICTYGMCFLSMEPDEESQASPLERAPFVVGSLIILELTKSGWPLTEVPSSLVPIQSLHHHA